MNLELHIERLVLRGVDLGPGDPDEVRAAATRTLIELFERGGLAPSLVQGGARPSLGAARMSLPPGVGPRRLGTGIAEAVYRVVGSPIAEGRGGRDG